MTALKRQWTLVLAGALLTAACSSQESSRPDAFDAGHDDSSGRGRAHDASEPADGGLAGDTSDPDASQSDASLARDCDQTAEDLEVCNDGLDNDCDGALDEQLGCTPRYDSCEDALDVGGGGSFLVGMAGTRADFSLASSDDRDVVFRFVLDRQRTVTWYAASLANGREYWTHLSIRTNCTKAAVHERPWTTRADATTLPAGEYHLIVAAPDIAEHVLLDIQFSEPSEPPANQSCSTAIDLGRGAGLSARLAELGPEAAQPSSVNQCGSNARGLYYTVTLDAESDLEISLSNSALHSLSLQVLTACPDTDPDADPAQSVLYCVHGDSIRQRLHQVPSGTYHLIVSGRALEFELDVQVLPPTPGGEGTSCGTPTLLPLNTSVEGVVMSAAPAGASLGCACGNCGRAVSRRIFRFELPSASDLSIELDTEGASWLVPEIQRVCGDPRSSLRCGLSYDSIGPAWTNVPAGSYYLVLSSSHSERFRISLHVRPPTLATPVSGNATCDTAAIVPEQGGYFTGSTAGLGDDVEVGCGFGTGNNDAMFRLDLRRRAAVDVHVTTPEGAHDTLRVYRLDATCAGLNEPCRQDERGVTTFATGTGGLLDPGSYFYAVESAASMSADQAYNVEFVVKRR